MCLILKEKLVYIEADALFRKKKYPSNCIYLQLSAFFFLNKKLMCK